MRILSRGLSDAGLCRDNNEDSFALRDDLGLYLVADGMGGHAAGEIASALAVETVQSRVERYCLAAKPDSPDPLIPSVDILRTAVQAANDEVCRAAGENPSWRGMGSTLVALWIRAERLVVAHVGDSRIYRIRHHVIEQLTEDHTLINEQLRQGLLSAEEAAVSAHRHVLTRAIGSAQELVVDIQTLTAEAGDRYLLCTDGLTDMLADETLLSLVSALDDPSEACARLVESANREGGRDNITAVLLHMQENGLVRSVNKLISKLRR